MNEIFVLAIKIVDDLLYLSLRSVIVYKQLITLLFTDQQ